MIIVTLLKPVEHDWLCSVRIGDDPAHVFSIARATEMTVRSHLLAMALCHGQGREVHLGMRAVDTDPLLAPAHGLS